MNCMFFGQTLKIYVQFGMGFMTDTTQILRFSGDVSPF